MRPANPRRAAGRQWLSPEQASELAADVLAAFKKHVAALQQIVEQSGVTVLPS
jgi:hypothetical protein